MMRRGWHTLNMLMASGRVAGVGRNSLIWVMDGKAYRHSYIRNVAVLIGDWFELCQTVRDGDSRYELDHIPTKGR